MDWAMGFVLDGRPQLAPTQILLSENAVGRVSVPAWFDRGAL